MPTLTLVLFLIFSSAGVIEAACTGSSPSWTSTPDDTSINSCVSSASRGDTINVTAGGGTVAWANALSLTRGVSLIGPGRDRLIVSRSGPMVSIAPDATAITNNETIRVLGFTFDGNNAALSHINIRGAGATSTVPFRKLIIENNRFKNSGTTTSGNGVIINTGQTRGVISNNIFDRTNVTLKIMGNDDLIEFSNRNFPFAYGNSDNLFFEDNLIQWSSGMGARDPGWTETGQGGRLVMRYNTWNFTNVTGSEIRDIHGFQNWPGGGQTGTMISEYYGQTYIATSGYRGMTHRGGWLMYFNNIHTGSVGKDTVQQYGPEDTGGSGCAEDVPGASGNFETTVNNTYAFNNTLNGANRPLTEGVLGPGCGAIENVAYRNQNALCTSLACVAGIGRDNTAPTGACVTGVGYWVASTSTPTVDPNVIQNGAFYKCTSTNIWTLYYKPYVYPHPLRNGSGSGTDITPPQAPSGLRLS